MYKTYTKELKYGSFHFVRNDDGKIETCTHEINVDKINYGFKNCIKIPSSKIYGIDSIMDEVRKLFPMIENRNYYFLQYDDLNIQIDKSYTFSIILNGVMNFNNHYFLSWRITDIVL